MARETFVALTRTETVSPFFSFMAFSDAVVMIEATIPAAVSTLTSESTLSLMIDFTFPFN